MALSDQTSVGWLALPRLAAGALLLAAGIQKLRSGFDAATLTDTLAAWQQAGATVHFYSENILARLSPQLALVATLVTVGEVAAGAALVLGLGTRLAALAGLVLAVNYLAASGESVNWLLAATHVALLGGAGRAFGLDGAIRARLPGWVLG